MWPLAEVDRVVMNLVQLRGAAPGDVAWQLRTRHILGTADLRPPGMLPSAVLIVKLLRDPLPGLASRNWPAGGRVNPDWEHAVQSSLAERFHCAARPRFGPVQPDADAVLFDDPADLLACLARDLVDGSAGGRWWWQAVLRTLPPDAVRALFESWHREPIHVPAAIERLTSWGAAARVVNALSPSQATNLLARIIDAYDVHALMPGVDATPVRPIPATDGSPPADSGATPPSSRQTKSWTGAPAGIAAAEWQGELYANSQVPPMEPDAVPVTQAPPPPTDGPLSTIDPSTIAPWMALPSVPAVPPLVRARAALVGVSLTLRKAPQTVRSQRFIRQFHRWYDRSDDAVLAPQSGVSFDPASRHTVPPISILRPGPTELRDGQGEWQPSPRLSTRQRSPAPDSPLRSERHFPTFVAPPDRPVPVPDTASESRGADTVPRPTGEADPAVAEPPDDQPIAREAFADGVSTSLGGIFFLASPLRRLGMLEHLADMHPGAEPGNAWDVVDVVAKGLLERVTDEQVQDSIWTTLGALAGRAPGEPPLPSLTGTPTYRIPASWIQQAMAPGTGASYVLLPRRTEDGFRLLHPLGFSIVDQSRGQAPAREQVEAEVRAFNERCEQAARLPRRLTWGRASSQMAPLVAQLPAPQRRIAEFAASYVRWWLRRALAQGKRAHDPISEMLQRRGRLHVTATHVDLVMDMDQIGLPVRMAGLDVDPRWVPELGRVITFHYV